MDPNLPTTPSNTVGSKKMLLRIGLLILVIVLIVTGLLLVKKLPLFQNKPSPSGTTPAKTDQKLVFAPPLIDPKDIKISTALTLTCPVTLTLCQSAANFKNNNLILSFSKSTPLKAAFKGEVETISSAHPNPDGTVENFLKSILISKERGLIAYYSFKGTPGKKGLVEAGEVIASSSAEPIKFENNKSLILEIQQIEATQTAQIKLNPKLFKP